VYRTAAVGAEIISGPMGRGRQKGTWLGLLTFQYLDRQGGNPSALHDYTNYQPCRRPHSAASSWPHASQWPISALFNPCQAVYMHANIRPVCSSPVLMLNGAVLVAICQHNHRACGTGYRSNIYLQSNHVSVTIQTLHCTRRQTTQLGKHARCVDAMATSQQQEPQEQTTNKP
jgi:hypothetical protein